MIHLDGAPGVDGGVELLELRRCGLGRTGQDGHGAARRAADSISENVPFEVGVYQAVGLYEYFSVAVFGNVHAVIRRLAEEARCK